MRKTNKIKYMFFIYDSFTKEAFSNEIMKNFQLNTSYTLLVRFGAESNSIFKMAGSQIGINTGDEHHKQYYDEIFDVIWDRLELGLDSYGYIESIESISIMYSIITPSEELKLKNVNSYLFNPVLVRNPDVKRDFNQSFLPLTLDTNNFGIKCLEKDKSVILKEISDKNRDLNFLLSTGDYSDIDIHLYTNQKNKKRYIISKKLDNFSVFRYVCDYSTFLLVKEIKDTYNPPFFYRKIGNLTLKFDKEKVWSYSLTNKLEPIKPVQNYFQDKNNRLGTLDIETFVDRDGFSKVYALGFKTAKIQEPVMFYLDKDSNSDLLVQNCIDSLLISMYDKYVFYVHNFSKFDVIFLYNILLKANEKKGFKYYNLKPTMRDSDIIRLDISIKVPRKNKGEKTTYNTFKISLRDSMGFFSNSLEFLTKELNISYKKGLFPHKFVNRETVNYLGDKPQLSFYINSKKVFTIDDHNFYNTIPIDNWDLKKECLSYLKTDLLALFEIIVEYNRLIWIHFNEQMFESLTITRLALNIFYKRHYRINESPIPYINKTYMFNFIKEGYFGGITEVYKPYGENLIYIDVNSLYPFSALKDLPALTCDYLETLDPDNPLDLDSLFGFFKAKIQTNNQYIGLLPLRIKNKTIYPEGVFEGIWSSEELKFARDQGYKITVSKGYHFDKNKDVFKSYILNLYNQKRNSSGFLRSIFKSLLNNFLGRFGLNFVKPVTEIVNKDKRDFILTTREVISHYELRDNKFIIKFYPLINKFICENHGVDYFKVLEKEYNSNLDKKLDSFKDVSIAISAMVNAYARVFMHKVKLDILKNNGQIYYSDTDSLVIDVKSLNGNWIGDEIGKFKLEFEIIRGYFISNKTYCLILKDGSMVIKSKGVSSSSLTEDDFKAMLLNNEKIKAYKYSTTTNFEKASVLIDKKEVLINPNSYNQREKICDETGNWKDTKPLIVNNNSIKE